MPALVTRTVTAADLKVGDLMVEGKIDTVDAKTKWVYVTVAGSKRDRKLELARGTEITIQRMEQTKAEKDAERAQAMVQWVDMKQRQAADALVKARAKVADTFAKGQLVDHWDVEALLGAQAMAGLWARVNHIHRVSATRLLRFDELDGRWTYDSDVVMTRLEAVDYMKAKLTEELVSLSHDSRSTSVVSNACEDIERQAKAAFLRTW